MTLGRRIAIAFGALVAAAVCLASCGDPATSPADPGSGVQGMWTLDSKHLAEQILAQQLAYIRCENLYQKAPDQTTVWMHWTEAQREEALRNTEARVRWQHQENYTVELGLEPGGRYTHTTRQGHTSTSWADSDRFHRYGGSGEMDADPIQPPPPPVRDVTGVTETEMRGRWELDGSSVVLNPEVYNGKPVPEDDRPTIRLMLEHGSLFQDHQYVHLYRRASE